MKATRLIGTALSAMVVLSGCAVGESPVETESVTEFDSMVQTASFREQLVPTLDFDEIEVTAGASTEATISLGSPGGVAPNRAWVTLEAAPQLSVDLKNSAHWDCSAWNSDRTVNAFMCVTAASKSSSAIASGLSFAVVAPDASGLYGISAQAGYGQPPLSLREWTVIPGQSDSTRSVLKVVSASPSSPPQFTLAATSTGLLAWPSTSPRPIQAKPANVQRLISPPLTAAALDSFCALYTALALSGGSQTAGPMTFSSLGKSSGNSTTCNADSVITLTSADISFAGVTFTNVNGTITPTQISVDTKVSDGQVNLKITGPYPETGAEFTAEADFAVGGAPIKVTGLLDYSVPSQLTIELAATASGVGYRPLPGFSLNAASTTGTFVRKQTSAGSQDSFDISLTFGGTWNPVGTVTAKELKLDLSNFSGDWVASVDTSFQGSIAVSDIDLAVAGLEVSGILDIDTGRLELNIELGKFGVAGIAELDKSSATFVYDPSDSAGGNSVFITGSAAFGKDIATFFAGDTITATVEFSEQGYLLTADLESSPDTAGFQVSSLQFVYTSLLDPSTPFQYAPKYPEAVGILIPLANESPLAIGVARALPKPFGDALKDLRIDIIDPNSVSVVAIELPPGIPKLSVYYLAPDQPYLIGSSSDSTYLRFDDVFLSIEAAATESFTIGGAATLHTSNTDLLLESALTITLSETGAGIDGYLELIDSTGWKNAFGLNGLTVLDLLLQAGIDDGLPSFGIEAKAEFPAAVTSPLGIITGSVITLGIDLSATTPCAVFAISAPPETPTANVISLDSGSLTAKDAELIIAPEGCQLGEVNYSGFAMNFDGAIRNVSIGFATTFELIPSFSLQGSGYIGTFPLGAVQMQKTTAAISISDAGFSFSLSGGLNAGSSVLATGTAYLASGGGFTFDGEGKVFINGNGSDIKVHATDCKDIACTELTDASFSVTGVVVINGFEFDASIAADSKGDFDAKLTIPNQSHDFSFSHSSPKVDGKGTFTYTISVEVSNRKGGEIDFSGSIRLKSCEVVIVFKENCSGSKLTWSDKISTGSVDVTITAEIAGSRFKSSLKL